MSQIYKCDLCGKVEPLGIRRFIIQNPEPQNNPRNKEKYYGLNMLHGDFCEECIAELDREFSITLERLKRERSRNEMPKMRI